jgi:hypothetical protein
MLPARLKRVVCIGGGILSLLLPSPVWPQAWVPDKGTGSVSVMYQDSYIKNHMDASGTRYFDGEIWSRGVVERIDYGLTDKLALDLSLPLIYSKYKGNDPEGNPPPGIDNGRFNGAFTDFRFDLRYNVRSHPLTLTPFIGTVVPSHNYQFFAHSAPGQRLHALVFGIAAGRRLDPVLPRAYFQTQYSFSLTLQHIFGYRPSHSQLDS